MKSSHSIVSISVFAAVKINEKSPVILVVSQTNQDVTNLSWFTVTVSGTFWLQLWHDDKPFGCLTSTSYNNWYPSLISSHYLTVLLPLAVIAMVQKHGAMMMVGFMAFQLNLVIIT